MHKEPEIILNETQPSSDFGGDVYIIYNIAKKCLDHNF